MVVSKDGAIKAGLFIPCYIDQLYPEVGMATVRLLEKLGVELDFPEEQTCCGQPMLNAGFAEEARPVARKFAALFDAHDYVVCPSGSCTSMVRNHYPELLEGHFDGRPLEGRVFELCEFIVDVLEVEAVDARFPHPVEERYDKVRGLLASVRDIEIVEPSRPHECCGFGGMFAVAEGDVSASMGRDKVGEHFAAGARYITGPDMSCLMHLDGIIRREKVPVSVKHIAEILAGEEA